MSFLSGRRLVPACVVSVAAAVAMVAPGAASASDLSQQCSGASIKGLGSTFQGPIQKVWEVDFNLINGVPNKNEFACGGTQGSGGKPKAEYSQTEANRGSGACLHDFGAETTSAPKYAEYPFCGTDEAPNAKQKEEIEGHATGAEQKSLETIPVLQGAVAVLVHLPEGCRAKSEIKVGTTFKKLGRLVLDDVTLEGIYRGKVNTWKQLIESQVADGNPAKDELTCSGGTVEEEKEITRVVRKDHSGTTHIFKEFLLQVNNEPFTAEAYPEEVGGKKTGCGTAFGEEPKSWSEVAEGCQNQRWPVAAKVLRPAESGNPGVVNTVASTASSIGYADLAVARENGEFSKKFKEGKGGGENKKGTETAQGEQNVRFWALVQNSPTVVQTGYADPASNGDLEKAANSNCAGTVYTNEVGKKFPPANTREAWNAAKAELVQKKYAICGLTYDLALRQYEPYTGETAEGKAQATSVENYLLWAVNAKAEGGGAVSKNHDYEKLTSGLIKEAEIGIKEIGYKEA
jgi:ABC-type phosphate transport system substrate-binding protein